MKNIKTDKTIVENGTDFTFVCRKVPFAVSCSELHHGDTNLIDLDIVNKMKIPLRNIRVTRMSLLGHDVRAVGRIKQTVQCVVNGRIQGCVHLEGKVVRDLYSLFNVDCFASANTYERLLGKKPPEPVDEGYESPEDIPNLGGEEEDVATKEEKEEEDSNAEDHQKIEEEEPPDPNVPPAMRSFHTQCLNMGYKDIDDCLENMPVDPTFVAQYNKINSIIRRGRRDEDTSDDNAVDVFEYLAKHGPGPTDRLVGRLNSIKNHDDQDEDEDEIHCNLCFREGKPIKIVTNHNDGCPTCPTMTQDEKMKKIGPNWKAEAEKIIKLRFQREKGRKQ